MKAVVSEKGQVTIPKALRERLGLRPGQVLDFREERGKLVAVKAATRSPLDELRGILKTRKSTDEIMRELRAEPDAVDP